MHDTPEFRRLALLSAGQASAALRQLTEAAAEGPLHHRQPFDDGAIEQLADAAKLAIEASIEAGEALDEGRGQLLGALSRYLEGIF